MTFSRRPERLRRPGRVAVLYLFANAASRVLRCVDQVGVDRLADGLAEERRRLEVREPSAATPASVMIAGTYSDGAMLTSERFFFSSALTTGTGSDERAHGARASCRRLGATVAFAGGGAAGE